MKSGRLNPAWCSVLVLTVALASTQALALGRSRSGPRAAVFLIPGAGSSGEKIYVHGIEPFLRATGDRYFGAIQDELNKKDFNAQVCPKTPDKDSRTIEERTEDCVQQILIARPDCATSGNRDVLLLGHSMGGLVARTLAVDPRVEGCIHSVTTVSTPHRGTPLSDWTIQHTGLDDPEFDPYRFILNLIRFLPEELRYIPQLRVDRQGQDPDLFRAQDRPDNPEVDYYSATSSVSPNPIGFLEASRRILNREIRARGLDNTSYGVKNDGIVPEYSQTYGTVIGHLEMSHFSSACIDPMRATSACKKAKKLLVNHLERISPK